MTDQEQQVEQLLQRYRPIGPAERLRRRVLATAQPVIQPSRTRRMWVFRITAAAAVVLLAIGLRLTVNLSFVATLLTPGKGF